MSDKSVSNGSGKTAGTSYSGDSESHAPSLPDAPPPTQFGGPDAEEVLRALERVSSNLTSANSTAAGAAQDTTAPAQQQPAPSQGVPEQNKWAEVAEEHVAQGLARLLNLAIDESKEDDGKSVQQYYSERLAKLIKAGEITFDCKYLH